MKQYKTLDIFKIIAAFLILVLHTMPFLDYSKAINFCLRNIICVIAVPFFFACSGFITFSKLGVMKEDKEKDAYIIRYIKRIGLMYIIWSAVYFVFVFYKWTKDPFTYVNILEYVRDFLFEGSYQTIWFLPALFSSTIIVYILKKKFEYSKLILLAIPFYLFALLGSSYWGLTQKVCFLSKIYSWYYFFFDTIKNGLLFGFIYVSIGAWIANKQDKLEIPTRICFIFVCISGLLVAIEAIMLNYLDWNAKGCDTIVSLIPMTISIMLLGLNLKVNFSNKICLICRKYSLLMFLVQRIPMSIIDLFMEGSIIANDSFVYFMVVFIVTMFLSFIIIESSKKIKFFKYLY